MIETPRETKALYVTGEGWGGVYSIGEVYSTSCMAVVV